MIEAVTKSYLAKTVLRDFNNVIDWTESAIEQLDTIGTLLDQMRDGEYDAIPDKKRQAETADTMEAAFLDKVRYLDSYGANEGKKTFRVQLWRDSSWLSFSILWFWNKNYETAERKVFMQGGLIFNGGTNESYSVSIGTPSLWSVNT